MRCRKMYYLFTFVWVIILVNMVNYVGGAMLESGYSFPSATIFGAVAAVFVIIASKLIGDEKTQADHH